MKENRFRLICRLRRNFENFDTCWKRSHRNCAYNIIKIIGTDENRRIRPFEVDIFKFKTVPSKLWYCALRFRIFIFIKMRVNRNPPSDYTINNPNKLIRARNKNNKSSLRSFFSKKKGAKIKEYLFSYLFYPKRHFTSFVDKSKEVLTIAKSLISLTLAFGRRLLT